MATEITNATPKFHTYAQARHADAPGGHFPAKSLGKAIALRMAGDPNTAEPVAYVRLLAIRYDDETDTVVVDVASLADPREVLTLDPSMYDVYISRPADYETSEWVRSSGKQRARLYSRAIQIPGWYVLDDEYKKVPNDDAKAEWKLILDDYREYQDIDGLTRAITDWLENHPAPATTKATRTFGAKKTLNTNLSQLRAIAMPAKPSSISSEELDDAEALAEAL